MDAFKIRLCMRVKTTHSLSAENFIMINHDNHFVSINNDFQVSGIEFDIRTSKCLVSLLCVRTKIDSTEIYPYDDDVILVEGNSHHCKGCYYDPEDMACPIDKNCTKTSKYVRKNEN